MCPLLDVTMKPFRDPKLPQLYILIRKTVLLVRIQLDILYKL
jgi:hypothetical protein